MADKHPVDPLAELDALLRAELAAEPSHEFLPHVRERIRTEPSPSRWRSLWTFAPALAAAGAIVVAIGVFVLSRENDTSPAPPPIASVTSPTQAPAPPPLPDLSATNRALAPRIANRRPRIANREPRLAKEPEVIVDEGQRNALFALMRMVNRGQLTEEAFKKTTPPPLDIEEAVTTIGVVPVSVSPIVVGGVLQGESERK